MADPNAYKFFESLRDALTVGLTRPDDMRQRVREIVFASKTDNAAQHTRTPESAFFNEFAIPLIFDDLQTVPGIDRDAARSSLLSENYRWMRTMCLGTPARPSAHKHPFSKLIGSKPSSVVSQWKGQSGSRLKQSCPDFGLRRPFPFTTVFEGKYFEKGGIARAESELVTNIYQAFFYRSLPRLEATNSSPAWDYDYACLLAYDASPEGSLHQAWNGLEPSVKRGFWEGAHVYVMIVRGEASPAGDRIDAFLASKGDKCVSS